MIRRLLARYSRESLATRAHVAVRWMSCPFRAVIAELPIEGDVLDVGCGHGVLAVGLTADRSVRVLGIDVDAGKIAVARRVAPESCRFEHVESGVIPHGTWDGIAVVDVLYLLPSAEQVALVERLAAALRPGGRLVVKEMDTTPFVKAWWMRCQEWIAVRLVHITKGTSLTFTEPDRLAEAMASSGLEVTRRRVDRWYPHPHVLLVGHRA